MSSFLQHATELFPYTQALRRDFHMHPELGFREVRTGGIVAKELEALGIEVTKGVGKTGVVGYLEGSRPGPTILLRFDMDALPISEETSAEYESANPSPFATATFCVPGRRVRQSASGSAGQPHRSACAAHQEPTLWGQPCAQPISAAS